MMQFVQFIQDRTSHFMQMLSLCTESLDFK